MSNRIFLVANSTTGVHWPLKNAQIRGPGLDLQNLRDLFHVLSGARANSQTTKRNETISLRVWILERLQILRLRCVKTKHNNTPLKPVLYHEFQAPTCTSHIFVRNV